MKKNKGKKLKLLKGEIMMYVLIIALVLCIPISKVLLSSQISETNYTVKDLEKKIKKQVALNESLSAQVDELLSTENLQKVADMYGLSYNSDNIITVAEVVGEE